MVFFPEPRIAGSVDFFVFKATSSKFVNFCSRGAIDLVVQVLWLITIIPRSSPEGDMKDFA